MQWHLLLLGGVWTLAVIQQSHSVPDDPSLWHSQPPRVSLLWRRVWTCECFNRPKRNNSGLKSLMRHLLQYCLYVFQVTDDGYGVCYLMLGGDVLTLHISCKNSCPDTVSPIKSTASFRFWLIRSLFSQKYFYRHDLFEFCSRMLVNLVPRSEQPSTTWYSCWVQPQESLARQKPSEQRWRRIDKCFSFEETFDQTLMLYWEMSSKTFSCIGSI